MDMDYAGNWSTLHLIIYYKKAKRLFEWNVPSERTVFRSKTMFFI